jgi:hypothetical protein
MTSNRGNKEEDETEGRKKKKKRDSGDMMWGGWLERVSPSEESL